MKTNVPNVNMLHHSYRRLLKATYICLQIKRGMLIDLVEYISSNRGVINEPLYQEGMSNIVHACHCKSAAYARLFAPNHLKEPSPL